MLLLRKPFFSFKIRGAITKMQDFDKNEYGLVEATMDEWNSDQIAEQKGKFVPLMLRISDRSSKLLQYYQLAYPDYNIRAELVNLIETFIEDLHSEAQLPQEAEKLDLRTKSRADTQYGELV